MSFCGMDRKNLTGVYCRQSPKPDAGFTLAEILVAISVFAVLVSIVLGSLSFLLSKTASIKEGLTTYEEARICLDLISADLRAVYVTVEPEYDPPGLDDDPDPYRFVCENALDEGARLEFTAFSHLPLGGGVPAKAGHITYYLYETDEDGMVLMRRDTTLKTDGEAERFSDQETGTDPILCRHVKTFNIVCFDEDGTEHDSWDSDSGDFSRATPVAVRVNIAFQGQDAVYPFETTVSLPVFREKEPDAI